jgi:phosphatidate cytidylyltransferase
MNKWSDLSVRAGSANVLAPLVIVAVLLGGPWFELLCASAGVVMALEWTNIAHGGNQKQFALHALAALAAVVLVSSLGVLQTAAVIFFIGLIAAVSGGLPRFWKSCGVAYVAFPILALMVLRSDPIWGFLALVWCFAIVWGADILAYFAGRTIGGPKLAPRLSPKKTWAGLFGAVFGACLVSLAFSYFVHLNAWPLVALAGVFAVLEQGGDILESAFKRAHDVKDSGNLIPGHGGVLDRVDGLMAVVLAAALVGYLHNPASVAAGLLVW